MNGYKRKLKRFFKSHHFIICFLCLALALSIMSAGYALLKSNLSITGSSEISVGETPTDPEDVSKLCQTTITTEVTNSWSENYLVNITLNNNSQDAIYSWKLKFTDSQDMTITSNHGTVTLENEYYYFSGLSWNSEIASENSITAEIQIRTSRTDINEILNSIIIVTCGRASTGEDNEVTSGGASINLGQLERQIQASAEITEAGAWGGGYNIYTITITNNLSQTITGWRGMVYYGTESVLHSVYPCNVTRDDEAHNFIASNTHSGDGTLQPGASVTFTLVLNTTNTSYIPDMVFAGVVQLS